MSIILYILLSLVQVNVVWESPECINRDLMGFYVQGTKNITVCKENAQKRREPIGKIIKHEFVHYVYDVRGPRFNPLPEPFLTVLVRKYLPSGETLFVIVNEKQYTVGEEFTARILSRLPDSLFLVWAAFQSIPVYQNPFDFL